MTDLDGLTQCVQFFRIISHDFPAELVEMVFVMDVRPMKLWSSN